MDHEEQRVLNNSNNDRVAEQLSNLLGSMLDLNNETSLNYSVGGTNPTIHHQPSLVNPPLNCEASTSSNSIPNLQPNLQYHHPLINPCDMPINSHVNNDSRYMSHMMFNHYRMQAQQHNNSNSYDINQGSSMFRFAAKISEKMINASEREGFLNIFMSRNRDSAQHILSVMASYPVFLLKAALDQEGSVTIKAMIKLLRYSPEMVSYLTRSLSIGIPELMTDKIGAEAIQQCFECLDYRETEVLSIQIVKHCIELALHPRGCIALNNIIFTMESQYVHDSLVFITRYSHMLAIHPYGNFVVQRIVGSMFPEFTEKIVKDLQGYYVTLSMQKSGSYLVQKCLKALRGQWVVVELARSDRLCVVACHDYGNFVIQTALTVTQMANHSLFKELLFALFTFKQVLSVHPRGKIVYRMLTQFKKEYMQ